MAAVSKTLRTVAVIAGAVALIAVTAGAAAGALAPTLAGSLTVAGVSTGTIATIGAIASVAATVANIGAQLTAKKPPARGAVNQVLIASDAPSPYLMGRTYSGGILRHDVGYGVTLKKVPNPYRAMVLLYSVAGPLQGLESPYLDFAPVSINVGGEAVGYYNQFLNFDYRVGNDPDSALIPHHVGTPGWSSAHKLSSKACALWNLKFDKDGKRFASGVPSMGAVWNGVKVYDPRLDSTYPGGSGAQRIANEATWTFSENPGLHALSYALGRYRNGKKVFGVGLPGEGIRIADFVTLANVCDANGWKVGGGIYEPGDRWANLKEILQAGGAEPLFTGGKLGCKINAPRVSLDTVTAVDLADDDAETTPMQSWRNRRNGIIPKYRSEAHKWEYVPSDLVSVPAYVTEDGEEKIEERQYNLVQQKNQAAQLAAYELVNGRELFPITLVCKPRLRKFGPGDMLTLDLPNDHGLANVDAVIVDRSIDPATMKVTLTFMSETDGKHDFALGRTGTAPPTPSLTSPQDRDDIVTAIGIPQDADGNELAVLIADALAVADRKRTNFWQETAPTAAQSEENDVWIKKSTGVVYVRVAGSGRLSIGGDAITLGGDHLMLCWTEASDQRIGAALLAAAGAQATADGKVTSFSMESGSDPEPVGDGIGDFLFREYLAPVQVDRWNGTDWVSMATYGATAEQAATIEAIVNDNVLSRAEKPLFLLAYQALLDNHAALDGKAAALGIAGTERAAAAAEMATLAAYLAGLSPSYSNPTLDTPIVSATFQDNYNDAASAVAVLQAAIQGAPGDDGAPGNTVVAIYRRSATTPSTPTGNLTPSGWSTSKPAPDGTPLWRSDGAISGADGTSLVGAWSTPTIFEAQTVGQAQTTIQIDSQNDTFGPIKRALEPSQSISVIARIRVLLSGSTRTQSITTEYRLAGDVSWTTIDSDSETDPFFIATGAVGSITNATANAQVYEIRAITVMSSPDGSVDLNRSYFTA